MKKFKKTLVLGLTIAMGLLTIACAKDTKTNGADATTSPTKVVTESNDAENGTDSSSNAGSTNEANSTNQSDSSNDASQTSELRVVASSVAVVQILDALGVPMVGVPTSSYELPESVANAERIGSAMSPDMEVIASLSPDIIVSVDSLSNDLKEQFANLNIETTFANLSSYDGLKETIKQLGERFSVEEKANELLSSFEEKETEIESKISGKESTSVLIIFGAGQSFMVASESSYVGDLAKRVGATNILEDSSSSFIPVDMEYLADKNPDYILFMAHANPEESLAAFEKEFETNKAWQNFDAVKNGNVVALETEYFGMSANLLAADAMEKLADILYTE